MTPPLVLRTKVSECLASVFGVLCFTAIFVWILLGQPNASILERVFSLTSSASFLVLGVAWFIQNLVSMTFDGASLSSEMPLRKIIRVELTSVSAVRHNFLTQTLVLLGAHGNILLKINESLPRFAELFEILRVARPDLWQIPTAYHFRIKRSFLLMFFSPFLLLIPLIGWVALQGKLTTAISALGVASVLAFLNVLRRQVVALDIVPDGLHLFFPFGSKLLLLSEITRVVLTLPGDNQASHYFLSIQSGEKQRYVIRAFEVHEVLLFDKLSLLMPDKSIRATKLDHQTIPHGSW